MISRDELKYKNIFLSNLIQEPKIKLLYVQWAIFNQSFYAKYFIVLAILFSILLLPLDYLWFKNPERYQSIRLLYIASLMPLIIFILRTASNRNNRFTSYRTWWRMVHDSQSKRWGARDSLEWSSCTVPEKILCWSEVAGSRYQSKSTCWLGAEASRV